MNALRGRGRDAVLQDCHHQFHLICLRSQVCYISASYLHIAQVDSLELRAKAEKAKDSSVQKLQNTRDRLSSQSSKNLEWDANHKRPPPGIVEVGHTRSSSSISLSKKPSPPPPPPPHRGPTPVRRDSRPESTSAYAPPPPPSRVSSGWKQRGVDNAEKIDWANLSPEDKQVFFSWLDEFFERLLNIKIPPRQTDPSVQVASRPVTPPRPVCILSGHMLDPV